MKGHITTIAFALLVPFACIADTHRKLQPATKMFSLSFRI